MKTKSSYHLLVALAILGSCAIAYAYIDSYRSSALKILEQQKQLRTVNLVEPTTVAPTSTPPIELLNVYRNVTEKDRDMLFEGIVTDPGVTWLRTPKAVGDLKLIVANSKYPYQALTRSLKYYQIGDDNGDPIYATSVPCTEMCFSDYSAYFVKQKDGTIVYLSKLSDSNLVTIDAAADLHYDTNNVPFYLADTVATREKVYQGLDLPSSLSIAGEKLVQAGFSRRPLEGLTGDPKPFQYAYAVKTPYGPLVYTNPTFPVKDESHFYSSGFQLILPSGLKASYHLSSDPISIVWNDGTSQEGGYELNGIPSGCGIGQEDAQPKEGVIKQSDLKQIGTANGNHQLYEIIDSNHPLFQEFYNTLSGMHYVFNAEKNQSEIVPISLDEYVANKGLLLYKDGFGRMIILSNTKYAPAVECGKPVIYLYPKQETDVRVQVGAAISVSEPSYGKGWNVHAMPDGTLDYKGMKYDSLFWEGLGYGKYPLKQNEGIVVSQAQVKPTLEKQLTVLGLNKKEQADFMTFWMPRMPQTTYTRLTWLTTADMDQLAPLQVMPKPDTRIRVFLDFQGLDVPVKLIPQKLSASPRKGFTLVEWGGLLVK